MYAFASFTRAAATMLLAASALVAVPASATAAPASAAPASAALVPAYLRFVQVETNYFVSAALSDAGEVYTWGDGQGGALGLTTGVLDSMTPRLVTFPGKPSDDPVVEIAVGMKHVLALTEQGEVWAWGTNDYGQLGLGDSYDVVWEPTALGIADYLQGDEKVIAISAGSDHSLALTDANGVFGWGDNFYYEVSYDEPELYVYTPVEYFSVREMFDDAGRVATRISADEWSSWVMSDEPWTGGERAFAWGYNEAGRLGIGSNNNGENRGYLRFPGSDPDARIVGFDGGVAHGIAVLDDGTVWTWGELAPGDPHPTPEQVTGLPDAATSKVVGVAAGNGVSFAITHDGRLFSWGSNGPAGEGQLGTGTVGPAFAATPTEVTDWPEVLGDSRIVDVSSGYRHTAGAISETGGLYMWGAGWGRGDESRDDTPIPTNVRVGFVMWGDVHIVGTPTVGTPVTAVAVEWPEHTTFFRTAWTVDGAWVGDGVSYTPVDGDAGRQLRATMTGYAENAVPISSTSDPSTVLAPAPPPRTLRLTPSATEVAQGGTLTFTAEGLDGGGNPTGDLTHDVVLSSDVPSDVIDGNTVTFPHASPHTITASFGNLTAQVVIEVIPAAAAPDPVDLASTGTDDAALLVTLLLAVGALGVGLAFLGAPRRRPGRAAPGRAAQGASSRQSESTTPTGAAP